MRGAGGGGGEITASGEPALQLPQETAEPLRSQRLGGVDIGRLFAALSVVGIHALAPGRALPASASILPFLVQPFLKWSLPFFVVVAGYLHGRAKRSEEPQWLASRLSHLLVPLVFWSLVFRVLAFADGESRVYSPSMFAKDAIFGLAWSHLWFLPVIAGCSVIVWLWGRWRISFAPLLILASLAAVGYVVIASIVPLNGDAFPTVYLYRTPMFWLFFYVAGYLLSRHGFDERWERLTRPLLAVGVAAVVLSIWPYVDGSAVFGRHVAEALVLIGSSALGVAASLIALKRPLPAPRPIERAATLSMAVYLLHPVVQYFILFYAPLRSSPLSPDAWAVLSWLVMSALSLAAGFALSRTRVRALVL